MKCLPIITLDGPAGVGKSTLAKRLATILGIPYLDTGALFRTIALRLGPGAETLPEDELRARCNAFRFKLQGGGEGSVLLCNDVPVGREIRTEEVGRLASRLATSTVVRDYLKEAQRSLGESGLVAEGRDMGTVVFPTARFKFFLDARPEVRGMRRFEELQAKGEPADLAQITEMIRQRDDMDRNRAVAPLKPAADAVIVDTSDLDIDGVLKVLTDTVAASSERIVREVRCCPKDAVEGAASGVRDAAFSHMAGDGSISMVDVGGKDVTKRIAIVRGAVEMNAHTLGLLKEHALPKGDVLVTAQVAGIMAAKRTSELIPLCHPVPLSFVDVRFEIQDEPPAVLIESEARTWRWKPSSPPRLRRRPFTICARPFRRIWLSATCGLCTNPGGARARSSAASPPWGGPDHAGLSEHQPGRPEPWPRAGSLVRAYVFVRLSDRVGAGALACVPSRVGCGGLERAEGR